MKIGTHISIDFAAERRSRGLTQANVARLMDMTQSEYSKLEKRQDVTLAMINRFLTAIKASAIRPFPNHKQRTCIIWPSTAKWEETPHNHQAPEYIPHMRMPERCGNQ